MCIFLSLLLSLDSQRDHWLHKKVEIIWPRNYFGCIWFLIVSSKSCVTILCFHKIVTPLKLKKVRIFFFLSCFKKLWRASFLNLMKFWSSLSMWWLGYAAITHFEGYRISWELLQLLSFLLPFPSINAGLYYKQVFGFF